MAGAHAVLALSWDVRRWTFSSSLHLLSTDGCIQCSGLLHCLSRVLALLRGRQCSGSHSLRVLSGPLVAVEGPCRCPERSLVGARPAGQPVGCCLVNNGYFQSCQTSGHVSHPASDASARALTLSLAHVQSCVHVTPHCASLPSIPQLSRLP